MATLLERLQSKMGQKSQAQFSDEAQRAAELLRARTGKQVTPSGPQAGSMAERIATGAAQSQLNQQAQAGQMTAQGLAQESQAQEQEIARRAEAGQVAAQAQRQEAARSEDQILQEYEQGQKQLDVRRDAADLEQLAHRARMENTRYIDNLRALGEKERLSDAARFSEEMTKQVFGSNLDSLLDQMDWEEYMTMDDIEFQKKMESLDMDWALDVAKRAAEDEKTRGMYTGIGQAFSGGAQIYASMPSDQSSNTGERAITSSDGTRYEQSGPTMSSGRFSSGK